MKLGILSKDHCKFCSKNGAISAKPHNPHTYLTLRMETAAYLEAPKELEDGRGGTTLRQQEYKQNVSYL